ncbi:hypothetical protein QO224_23110, partial [Vibrio vulnificus]|nr:hypothetical protein [Vibrio vulnificus]
ARTVVDLEKGEITVSYFPPAEEEKAEAPVVEAEVVNAVIEKNAKVFEEVGVTQPKKEKKKKLCSNVHYPRVRLVLWYICCSLSVSLC